MVSARGGSGFVVTGREPALAQVTLLPGEVRDAAADYFPGSKIIDAEKEFDHGGQTVIRCQLCAQECLIADVSLFDLTGKKALVTGGAMGIVRGCAVALARAGAARVRSFLDANRRGTGPRRRVSRTARRP